MAFLFGRTKRLNPLELPTRIRELNNGLASGDRKAVEDAVKVVSALRQTLGNATETETTPEQIEDLVEATLREDTLLILTQRLTVLPFESRKDIQAILSGVLRYKSWKGEGNLIAMDYVIRKRPDILIALCKELGDRNFAIHAHPVLREVIKNEQACAIILYDDGVDRSHEYISGKGARMIQYDDPQNGKGVFWDFFNLVENSAFDVGAEAFTTFKELLTQHKQLVGEYLRINFSLFFSRYNALLQSPNYVTKRTSIKLLGELLLEKINLQVMTAYVAQPDNLKIAMRLLSNKQKMVAYEGFHVFKVFVANPQKSIPVQEVLIKNREKLLDFLPNFQNDRKDDDQFNDEKAFLIRQIRKLPATPVSTGMEEGLQGGMAEGVYEPSSA